MGWVGTLGPPPFAEKFQQFLLALNTTLYGLWSIRGNWTGNEKTTLYYGSLPLADEKYKKTMLYTSSPWPTSPPACPYRPIKGRSSSRRLEYRGAHLLQEYRGAALLLERKGAYLVLEYSSRNTEEPSFY